MITGFQGSSDMGDGRRHNERMFFESNATLIVIDVQKGFADPSWGTRNNPKFEANLAAILSAWSEANRPVVLVRHDSRAEVSPLHPDSDGNALEPAVAGVRHDLLVSKNVNSAFYGQPDLHSWLQERDIRQLVICGIQTNMCVETTTRMGGNLGYDVIVPLDATFTFDLAGPQSEVLTADELSRGTAVNLHGGGFARVVSTAELLA
jgi:nicotinamidase-related amidase